MKHLILCTMVLATGCNALPVPTNTEEPEQPTNYESYIDTRESKGSRVSRELTLAYRDAERGGAVIRQEGYRHVLGAVDNGSDNTLQGSKDVAATLSAVEAIKDANNTVKPAGVSRSAGRSYSFYELSRWERFCDNGKGMDERDWRFIKAQGRASTPAIIHNCQAPRYDYKDYLAAWTAFCESHPTTSYQRDIVRNSVRPFSVVNPCAAIR